MGKWTTLVGLLTGCALMPAFDSDESPWQAQATRQTDDAVVRAIFAGGEQPRDIFEIRQKLHDLGGRLETHIVANRGHDNPEAGSFSFFESYSGPMQGGQVKEGDLFIGFFSERQGQKLAVQQSVEPGLMVELIAWDYTKHLYNFWELVGNGHASEWHFRGDSHDILADIAQINSGQNPAQGVATVCAAPVATPWAAPS